MARTDQAKIRRFAVFVKELRNDRITGTPQKTTVYVRRPYNIVEYDWSDGRGKQTFQEPVGDRPRSRSESEEVYDDLKIFENPPDWDRIGRG